MTEAFLLLLAGGVMFAAAVPAPATVTLHWLRLAGIIALALTGLAGYFAYRRMTGGGAVEPGPAWGYAAAAGAVLAQLALVQLDVRRGQRAAALLGYAAAVAAVVLAWPGAPASRWAGPERWALAALTAAGVAAAVGLVLMAMLLGHAYLTASRMTMAPFRRLNLALAGALVVRALCAAPLALWLNHLRPAEYLWGIHGLLICTRWLVGLAVPLAFVYMAHDCIRRRSNQSATGILYVAGLLVFIGELCALHLARATGLPF